jgi:hypothetical protein
VYTSFIIYLAARIFSGVVKSDPSDDSAKSSMVFLLSALAAMKEAIPLAEIYLVQLDLEGICLAAFQGNAQPSSGLETNVVSIFHPYALSPSSD